MLGRFLLDMIGARNDRRAGLESAGSEGLPDQVIALDNINALVKARHGWFLANRHDVYLGRALIRYGECSQIEHEFLASLVGPGDVVVEVGSNIGIHTVGLAMAVGPTGRVIAAEAQPAIFRVLCANLALNSLFNVDPHACGCSDRSGSMIAPSIDYAAANNHNSGGASLASSGEGISVPVVPLDELVEDVPRVRLLKVDVEGMEREVLQGASGLVDRCRPWLYVENDRFDRSIALIEWIMAKGYRLWWHLPPLFNPANFFGIGEDDFPGVVSCNMFCQPKDEVPREITRGLSEITHPTLPPLRS